MLIRWSLTAIVCMWAIGLILTFIGVGFGAVEVSDFVAWTLAALCTAGLWIYGFGRRRRARLVAAGRCVACGYDRRGLAADAKCPECGLVAK